MKRRSICIIMVAALAVFAACTDPIESIFQNRRNNVTTLTAMTEQPGTKTTVVSGTHVYWEPGDEIAVFTDDTSGRFVTNLTEPSGTAVFEGVLPDPDGSNTIWAVYPYSKDAMLDRETGTLIAVLPSTQVARAGSFGKDVNLSVARTNRDYLQFYNVGGGVCFTVTEEGIKKVMFEGLNGELLSGAVRIGFDDAGLPVVNGITGGSQFITLLPPEGETFQPNTWYYIVALPGALEKGYKMRFYKSDTYARRLSENTVTIKRGTYGDVENADGGLTYESATTNYPQTKQEWNESDDITKGISVSVNSIIERYQDNLDDDQTTEQIARAVSGLEGVASVVANEDGSNLLIKQNNGVFVNLMLKQSEEKDEEYSWSAVSPVVSPSPSLNPSPATKSIRESVSSNVTVLSSKEKKAVILSPYQNDFPDVGPIIDTEYLSSILEGIGYQVLVIPPDEIRLEHFTGDYLSQFPLVLIASHGADRLTVMDGKVKSTALNTGIEAGSLDDGVDRSLLSLAICNGKPNYYVTLPWLAATTSDDDAFSGSMVYFGSCRSFKDEDIAGFFESQHAGYLGHSKIMAVQFDNLVMHSLVTSLAMGMNFSHAVECISSDPWVKKEQSRLSGLLWFFDYSSSSLPTFRWKVSPSKLRKVDSDLHLIDSKPINLKKTINGNKVTFIWDVPHSNGDFQYKVHVNGSVFDAHTSRGYTTDQLHAGDYTWFVDAELVFDGEVVESFRSDEDSFTIYGGEANPSEAIDLGLSVKWSSANIGASFTTDPGYYYAWGELKPDKGDYTWETYDFGNPDALKRYNGEDGLRILLPEDDIVHQTLGGNWRMPTAEEWDELKNNCTWEEIKDDDILLGYNVKSKTNDNFIFLPVSGYMEGTELKNPNSVRCWNGSLSDAIWVWDRARNLTESTFDAYYHGDVRYLGMPVRGVLDESANGISSSNYVDLGLSVKWAGCNVGASAPEDLGNYYAWGNPDPAGSYDWDNYPLRNQEGEITRYNALDVLTCLKREDDAAYQVFGGPYYRMPTMSEYEELINECEWIPSTLNGRRGYKIISRKNQKSIFLPVFGFMDGTQLRDGMRPRYWSSTKTDADWIWDRARNLNESTYDAYYHGDVRCLGMPVRAVYDNSANQMGLGSGDFVDMGLSVDWARCNMGSTLPEETGDYYAWGEINTKTSYSWENYTFGTPEGFSKYNSEDGLRIMSKDNDIVYKRYGGEHRIPTNSEWEELWNNCDRELRRINNRWGYLLTSKKNGNSIFLPLSGYLEGTQLRDGMQSRYWSSSLSDAEWVYDRARNLNESTFDAYYHGDARCLGMPIRAIRAKYERPVTEGEIVDLGLKVKWASCNVGATVPEDTGDYFAWGETTTKSSFTLDNYRFCTDASSGSFSKYNSDDCRKYLDWNDDVVQIAKGDNWRMPTYEDWVELQEYCEWELTTMNGTRGYRIVSKINANSIFLPISGFKDGTQIRDEMRPRYWSSTKSDADRVWDRARNLNESTFDAYYHGDSRFLGMPVRGVYDYSSNQMQLGTSEFVDLGLSVDWARCNMGSTLPQQIGNYYAWGETRTKTSYSWENYQFGKPEELSKYNADDGVRILYKEDDVVYKKYSGKYRIPTKAEWEELWNNCNSELRRINNRWGYLLTSKKNGNSIFLPLSGFMDGSQIRDCMQSRYWSSSLSDAEWVNDRARDLNESTFDAYYHGDARCYGMPVRAIRAKYEKAVTKGDLIDLGLKVKWASCNVGADIPEAFGNYYAWGETTAKTSFSWDNYQHWTDGDPGYLKKYNSDDSRRYLDWNDDVVHVKKGGSWRMPTIEDWAELQEYCDWELTTMNGTRGYRIVSKINDNSIFLPMAGLQEGTQLRDGMKPRYWSSVLSDANWVCDRARNLNESTFDAYYHGDVRFVGMPVRGVYDDSAENVTEGNTIDMGLSVDWASCNIGSSTPEGFGSYFGWGETSTHDNFNWINYAHSVGETAEYLTKYTSEDKLRGLDNEDDAAQKYSGNTLRMPTIEEWEELKNNSSWELKIRNGHLGYLVTSAINGNTLFLPIAGFKDGKQLRDGMRPRYWASMLSDAEWVWDRARNLNESTFDAYYHGDVRYLGMPVRGVVDGHNSPGIGVTGVSLDQTQLNLSVRGTAQLEATVSPSDATNQAVTWSSDKESVATVSSDGLVTAVAEGTATITVRTVAGGYTATCSVTVTDSDVHVTSVTLDRSSMTLSVGCGSSLLSIVSPSTATNDAVTWHSSNPSIARISAGGRVFAISSGITTITVTTVDGNYSASCQVSVNNNKPFESKDLGLSVQWATFNVGASNPEEYGEYFAWGETEPKDAYQWDNYKWGNGFSGSLTKYTGSSADKLSSEDDVAQVYWGEGWRMPTMAEQQELIDDCDWVWTREGLVYGYRVTSRKPGYTDQSIFLPASGCMEGTDLKDILSGGRYWSSTVFYSQTAQAYLTNFSSSGKNWSVSNRCQGLTVRPVTARNAPEVSIYTTHTKGVKPITICVLPDGYQVSEKSTFVQRATAAMDFMFSVEPYKSMKDYFNVYFMWTPSEESGASITDGHYNVITPKNTAFGSKWGEDNNYGDMSADENKIYALVTSYCPEVLNGRATIDDIPVLLLINDTRYGGVAHIDDLGRGRSYCMVPYIIKNGKPELKWHYPNVSATSNNPDDERTQRTLTYQELSDTYGIIVGDWRYVVLHEFGGHSIGRLHDEYWEGDDNSEQGDIEYHNYRVPFGLNISGWYDDEKVPWKELLAMKSNLESSNPLYARIGKFQGGGYAMFNHWRSEELSCMLDSRPYFSTWQRYLIAKRIKELAGESLSLTEFLAIDKQTVPTNSPADMTKSLKGTSNANFVPMLPPPSFHRIYD